MRDASQQQGSFANAGPRAPDSIVAGLLNSRIVRGPPDNSGMDEIFKAMADPNRRQILAALCRESREAGELARLVGLAPSAVSFHLRALKSADLVTVRRDGRYLRYAIAPTSVLSWRSQVDRLFPSDLLHREPGPAPSVPIPPPDPSEVEFVAETPGQSDQLPTELL
jgi:ArsR family transcriptional regulator